MNIEVLSYEDVTDKLQDFDRYELGKMGAREFYARGIVDGKAFGVRAVISKEIVQSPEFDGIIRKEIIREGEVLAKGGA